MFAKLRLYYLLQCALCLRAESVSADLKGQSVLYGLSLITKEFHNSTVCYQHIQELFNALDARQVWALKALDASGQPGPGFLYGNNLWLGSHAQCLDISNIKKFEISYEKVKHAQPTPNDFPPFPMGFYIIYLQHNNTLQYHTHLPQEFKIQVGLCLPDFCSEDDLFFIAEKYFSRKYLTIQNLYELNLELLEVKHLEPNGSWMWQLPKTISLIAIFLTVVLFSIIGTVLDVKEHNREKNLIIVLKENVIGKHDFSVSEVESYSKKLDANGTVILVQIFKCFSIYSNVKNLVKTTLPNDSIPVIHGLRFFGMLWVIMVHAIFYQADYIENNAIAFRLSEDIFSQILSNSTYCVDTYLFLSGFLVAYLFFKSTKGEVRSNIERFNYLRKVMEFLMMFLNRFLRLTPLYAVVILGTDVAYTYYHKTSSLTSSERPDVLCSKYWWRNILYINNLYPRSEMCMSWSWYLSIDTQFFLITIFLLIMSTIFFKLSAILVFALIIANIFLTTYKSYSIGYIPTLDEQLLQLDAIYDLPWNRIGPYLVGVITAYVLLIKLEKQLILKESTRIVLWIIFPFLNLWILFSLYTRQLSVEYSAIYMGLSRTLWGIGLGWLLVACCTGNAGILAKFLSFKGWIPLSRLTYCAYLLNPLLANMLYMGSDNSYNASIASFSLTTQGVVFSAFFMSFVFSILFESPFILLTKMLFRKLATKKSTSTVKKDGETGTV